MKKWLVSKLAGPVLPILLQVYRVLAAVENSLNDILKIVTDLGVPTETPIFNTIKTVITAVIAIKVAVQTAIEFLGGVVPVQAQTAALDLDKEIEELKKML